MEIRLAGSEMVTVLVVCADAQWSVDLVARLSDGGASVVGPAGTAAVALALAAQAAPQVAVVAGPPAGRRDAAALSRALHETWGVDCLVLLDESEATTPSPADPHRLSLVRRLLAPAGKRDVLAA